VCEPVTVSYSALHYITLWKAPSYLLEFLAIASHLASSFLYTFHMMPVLPIQATTRLHFSPCDEVFFLWSPISSKFLLPTFTVIVRAIAFSDGEHCNFNLHYVIMLYPCVAKKVFASFRPNTFHSFLYFLWTNTDTFSTYGKLCWLCINTHAVFPCRRTTRANFLSWFYSSLSHKTNWKGSK